MKTLVGTFNKEKALVWGLLRDCITSASLVTIVVILSQEIQAFVQGSSKMGRAHTDDEQLKIEKHHVNWFVIQIYGKHYFASIGMNT